MSESCVETPEAPAWLSKLESQREKLSKARLGHDSGAGASCNSCGKLFIIFVLKKILLIFLYYHYAQRTVSVSFVFYLLQLQSLTCILPWVIN